MPWANAWSGGGVVVASSVEVVNNQSVVAAITPAGDIIGQNIYSNGDVFLNGGSLTKDLAAVPTGVVSWTGITTLPTASFGATESGLFELDTIVQPGRLYSICLSNMHFQAAASGCLAFIIARYTVDGSQPTTSSDFLFEIWAAPSFGANFGFIPDTNFLFAFSDQTNLRLLITSTNNTSTHQFVASGNGTVGAVGALITIEDLGPLPPNTGIYLGGSGGTPTKVFRTFQTPCVDSQSFTGSGAASPGSGATNQSNMYYGQDPGYAANGIWRSYAWFNTNDTSGGNGLGSLANMVGIAAGDISYLDVYVDTVWWYYVAGGTLYIGHGNGPISHGSETGAVGYGELTAGFSSRGQGKWISLLGTPVANAILGGTFDAIILGPPPTGDISYYGYAAGQADPNNRIQIRAGYYK